jgi:hypothetical protein
MFSATALSLAVSAAFGISTVFEISVAGAITEGDGALAIDCGFVATFSDGGASAVFWFVVTGGTFAGEALIGKAAAIATAEFFFDCVKK